VSEGLATIRLRGVSPFRFALIGFAIVGVVAVASLTGTSAGTPAPVPSVRARDAIVDPTTDTTVTDIPDASTAPPDAPPDAPPTEPATEVPATFAPPNAPVVPPPTVSSPAEAPSVPATASPASPGVVAPEEPATAPTPPPTVCYDLPPRPGVPYDPSDPANTQCGPA
jgi:hypothetical protein